VVDEERLKSILFGLLFAAGEPVTVARLAAVLDDVPRGAIQRALNDMAAELSAQHRGVVIEEVAGGYQMRTPREHAAYVRKLLAARPPRLSRPLLETLAIVAYRQPITRPEIEQLRGVDSGAVLETLLERRLVKIEGRKEAPGRPMLYATTDEFLEVFGLKDLGSLPDLKEFREIEETVGQMTTGPVESVETHLEDAAPATAEADAPESPPPGDDSESTG
jgi:segregation and condensation protein B